MIEIQNIIDATKEDIMNLLLSEEGNTFEIYIPKSTQMYFSSNENIAMDYAMLAYAGQKLKEVADEFEYNTVQPHQHNSVLFKIKPFSTEYLADALLEISYGYENDPELEQYPYMELVDQFISDVEDLKIIPACPDFIDYYNDFIKQVEDNDDEE